MLLLRPSKKLAPNAFCFPSIAKASSLIFPIQRRALAYLASQRPHARIYCPGGLSTKRPRFCTTLARSVIVPDGTTINSSAILAALQRAQHSTNAPHTEAVFLVTPRLAPLFEHDYDFLCKIMTAIYGTYAGSSKLPPMLSSVVAVVDKIPGRWLTGEERLKPCEGVSMVVPSPTRSLSPPSAESSAGSSLSIEVTPIPFTKAQPSFKPITCKVPLANTLFINGQSTTMIRSTWKPRQQDSSKQGFFLDPTATERLTNYTVQLTSQSSPKSVTPLTPLTSPRPIHNAMGNIVREILLDAKEPAPASTELETAVMASVKSFPVHEAVEPRTRIYALIRSPESSTTPSPSKFMDAIFSGAGTLHQVIGGGGGWGKKRGLLALDPAGMLSYSSNVNVPERSMPGLEDGPGAPPPPPPDSHSSVARQGDTIQFFQLKHNLIRADAKIGSEEEVRLSMTDTIALISSSSSASQRTDTSSSSSAPSPSAPQTTHPDPHPHLDKHETTQPQQHLLLGTIPTSETLESFTPPHSSSTSQSSSPSSSSLSSSSSPLSSSPDTLPVYPGIFGALSEKPIEIYIERTPEQDGMSTSSIRAGGGGRAVMSVPYSYFTV